MELTGLGTMTNKQSFYGAHQQNSPKRQSPASDDDTTERQTPTRKLKFNIFLSFRRKFSFFFTAFC